MKSDNCKCKKSYHVVTSNQNQGEREEIMYSRTTEIMWKSRPHLARQAFESKMVEE